MSLSIYNSLSRKKEIFKPIEEGFVGMYSCGPTVYSDVHLGNCRTFISFDLIYRYLLHLGYQVRYVRNITDVGHLTGDSDDGEDKVSKQAKKMKLEPMEVVQKYTNGFHDMMRLFNTLSPSIEPRATQHIIEQIEMVETIIKNGYGYVANGSVYFDTVKFSKDQDIYGNLSGRVIDELLNATREELKSQDEKRNPTDFAIWMKAPEEHLMKWNSPWSVGFPGWHLECSAMSTKYLGKTFDIHGGGNDLKFPHHENEIAQNYGACGCAPANYWIHTNMLLMNGKKMSKSDGNNITPVELLSGNSQHISKGYTPMTIKFFMLQAHYSSTLDLTDEGLQAAEKGYKRMMEAHKILSGLQTTNPGKGSLDEQIGHLLEDAYEHMDDDFNTPRALASIFEIVTLINKIKAEEISANDLSSEVLQQLKTEVDNLLFNIMGLKDEHSDGDSADMTNGLVQLLIELRQEAREKKDWATSDKVRDDLLKIGIQLKDGKGASNWSKI